MKLPDSARYMVLPLLLIVVCPPTAIVFWHTNVALGGSFHELLQLVARDGALTTLYAIWRPVFFGSPQAWAMLGAFAALELVLMRLVPGKVFHGPVTPQGNVPVYKANGVACFAITLGLFLLCAYPLRLFPATIVYDHFGALLGALNLVSLLLCLFLYVKGRMSPSSSDHSRGANPIFDYYWGTELFPRVLGWDVKMFTNCRFGMMGWAVIVISFATKQHELHGLSDAMIVSVAIQLLYITKFFWWETGYLGSLDITHDRAGFYICWGCMVWVPAIYTSPALYLVHHPNQLGAPVAIGILALGVLSVCINYFADAQRQCVRATHGECKVWGRIPEVIVARHTTPRGEVHESLLLASGWWGISRHFHYIPELLAALLWSLPALFEHSLPYFYVAFLGVLLAHRARRHDRRCAAKYGGHWSEYCKRVRYSLIPGLI